MKKPGSMESPAFIISFAHKKKLFVPRKGLIFFCQALFFNKTHFHLNLFFEHTCVYISKKHMIKTWKHEKGTKFESLKMKSLILFLKVIRFFPILITGSDAILQSNKKSS